MKDLRHKLHKYPELSGKEKGTAGIIIEFLEKFRPDRIYKNIGGYGLAALYKFGEGPTVMIRCDLDALPIHEETDIEYKSKNKGVSHKCGHDGHMTIVAGLAPWLAERPFNGGRVVLLFQPAEETARGAEAVLKDPQFKEILPDYIFALHNLPGYPLHSVIIAKGQMTPTVVSLAIRLTGKTSHAAEPDKGINPTLAAGTLNMAVTRLANNDISKEDYSLITPVHTRIGTMDYGISPGEGEVHFTVRSKNEGTMAILRKEINKVADDICKLYHLTYKINESDYFPTVINNDNCTEIVAKAAGKNTLELIMLDKPIRVGEDFGFFTRDYKAALFGLGAGKDAFPLHHQNYDFCDELIPSGIKMFKSIISQIIDGR